MNLEDEGERILDSVVDGIADEFIAQLQQNPGNLQAGLPAWCRFTNPITGEPFVSEKTITKCVALIRMGLARLPPGAKQRIAEKAINGQVAMADQYAKTIIRGKPTGGIIERAMVGGGLMVRYDNKATIMGRK